MQDLSILQNKANVPPCWDSEDSKCSVLSLLKVQSSVLMNDSTLPEQAPVYELH